VWKIIGTLLIGLGLWVSVEINTQGFEGAFGGHLSALVYGEAPTGRDDPESATSRDEYAQRRARLR
jgi:hypothetical protein